MNKMQVKVINGEMYISTPSVIVKAGVLGKSLLTQSEMEKSLQAWNGVELTMRHPKVDDEYVSVKKAEDFVIGYFDDAQLDIDKIKGRMWLNAGKLAYHGVDGAIILENIINDVPTEVSTSYFYDKQQGNGVFNGEQYEYATLNITPDHIAILPDQNGNCSWKDGCGIPRVNTDAEQLLMIRRQLTHNSFDSSQGENSMDEQQEVTPVVEEEIVEVNEIEDEITEEVVEASAELSDEPSKLDAFISEIGFDNFASAVRSLMTKGEQETNSLVANAAKATGIDKEELSKLSNEALRALTANKRTEYAAVGSGIRSNSKTAEVNDGWITWAEQTQ